MRFDPRPVSSPASFVAALLVVALCAGSATAQRAATVPAATVPAATVPSEAPARAWEELLPPVDASWRLVIYVDPTLVPRPSRLRAGELLASRAPELTALGTVEVVVAAPEPETRLAPTRDPERVAEVLRALAGERLAVAEDLTSFRARMTANCGRRGDPRVTPPSAVDAADAAGRLVEDRLDVASAWLAAEPGASPRALLWLADDLEPTSVSADELARRLALAGWTSIPVAGHGAE